ncbi:MAG: type II toxin-antitoxin system Phd/YefM family antitoxin [Candidatus Sumerlaeota bacterium]|nr:type II toxin-antitoxin system Phd/YefM family antitoxin [Candidatus Sumerlaeota bacterium]
MRAATAHAIERKRKNKKLPPQVVYRNGAPTAVILGIDDYREILERLEDWEDLREMEEIRSKPLSFRSLDEFRLSRSLRFRALLERSRRSIRAGKGLPRVAFWAAVKKRSCARTS